MLTPAYTLQNVYFTRNVLLNVNAKLQKKICFELPWFQSLKHLL